MRHKSDFPALSESVSTINKITESDKGNISSLSNMILKDFSLTNKIPVSYTHLDVYKRQ